MKIFLTALIICVLLLVWYVVIPISQFLDEFSLVPEANPAPVCGRLSDAVIEVPSQYLFFWAEYEGKSSWEVGFSENKKGCDANLVSLVLEMIWPSMKPFPKFEDGPGRTRGHVTIHLQQANELFFDRYLKYLLSSKNTSNRSLSGYDEVLSLNYVLNTRMAEKRESKNIYWTSKSGEISTILECTTLDSIGVYGCRKIWFLAEYKASVSLSYATDFLMHWESMQIDVNNFVKSHIINKNIGYSE